MTVTEDGRARLTRAERREQTRELLLKAAAHVFAERGLLGATVDEIAAAAGFTKGAIYANFGSKDELFMTMLEQRYDVRMSELERVLTTPGDPLEHARTAGADFIDYLVDDPDWQRIYTEATLHAGRDEKFREAFRARHEEMQARLASTLERRFAAGGIESAVPFERLASMISAMASGAAFEAVHQDSGDGLLPDMLALLAAAVVRPAGG